MIKQKFDEPKEELEKEIKKQNDRLERIRKAYISGAFDLKEYNVEKKIVEDAISKLKSELNDAETSDELNFTPQDILLKRDIDFINKVKLEKEYKEKTKTWKDYTREEKANLIMNYVDDIKLGMMNDYIYVDNVNFRESICKPCNELFDAGYIDVKSPALFGNLVGHLRFSNYLPEEEVGKHIMRLRQYYNVGFEEATYYVEDRIFYFNFIHDSRAIVRVFPLEDYCKIDPDIKMKEYRYGIIYIRENDEFQMEDVNSAFDYISDESNDSVIYMKEPVPIEIGVKPVKKELLYEEE
ncbi:MAG: hypothetical protein J6J17_01105 [Bacilli bacterium]|nr:hypothetical protein [Bacilli bacterium]